MFCGGPLLGHVVCNGTTSSFYGPICACAGPTAPFRFATCTAPVSYPEQINLQIASAEVVVVSFVTFEEQLPVAPPAVQLVALDDSNVTVTGVAHRYTTSHASHSQFCDESLPSSILCLQRNYTMSFVRLSGLSPRQRYEYRVKSGGENARWSEVHRFRALYSAGPTRIAVYGDMGNTLHNNMANLKADCVDTAAIDAIVHLGDHCYDLSMGDDLHGDAYMNAFQPVLASCPWLPVIGNHESTSGAGHDKVDESAEEHYLNQTWGVVMDSTADSGLGHLLTKATAFSAGDHGKSPSRTSQWASVDIGLIHFAVLDLDPGPPPIFAGAQAAWLEADLAKAVANRKRVPWIVVGSHFPLYAGRLDDAAAEDASLAWYGSEEGEGERGAKPWDELPSFLRCSVKESSAGSCSTVGGALRTSRSSLEPLLDKYGVDLYVAGHIHSYSVSWPIKLGVVAKKSLVDPQGVVHVLEGQGGVPNKGAHDPGWTNRLMNCSGTNFRMCGTGGAYGRLLTSNASVLVYEHVDNPTGLVSDRWAITRSSAARNGP
jgi:predicted phosphodiesterase